MAFSPQVEASPWSMSSTCFGVYGTKRKHTFSQEEPHNQFCSSAKRACMPSHDIAMEEEALIAVTAQPLNGDSPQPFKGNSPHTPSAPSPLPQQNGHGQPCGRQNRQTGGSGDRWLSWQNGLLSSWKEAVEPSADRIPGLAIEEPGLGQAWRRNGGGVEPPCGGGGGGGGDGKGVPAPHSPRVEIDVEREPTNWQTSENIHKQLQKQLHSPDLEQTRRASLRARAEQLDAQLQYMESMDAAGNDYWALPQENRLKMEDELEQARVAMESDYVPDPYQYHCSDIPVPMPSHDAGSFNQVRCYCKPNWEGMMDPVAYI